MGDTVAHAASAPEDQESTDSKRRADRSPGPGGGGGGGSGATMDKPVKQNGDVLSEGNGSLNAALVKIETRDKDKNNSGVVKEGPPAGNLASVQSKTENGRPTSIDEGVSLSKDGSAENISSIENDDRSIGNDSSLDVSTYAADDTSPESETCPEIDSKPLKQSCAGSRSALAVEHPTPENAAAEANNPVRKLSSTESGFAEDSVASDTNSEARPAPLSDKMKEGGSGSGVTCGDKAVPGASSDCGLPSTPSRSTVSDISNCTPQSQMEQELKFMKEEVQSKTASVQRLQISLYDQQVRANVAMVALRTQLRNKDRKTQKLREEHEQRMSALLSHLLFLEGQMRKEQRQVLELLHEKDDIIRRQKSAIEDLASKNARLLAALKEVHGYSGGNGISSPHSTSGAVTPEGSMAPTPVVLRNKDKGGKVRFSSVKDKLRRHKSSLELHRPASLDTLIEGTLRYSSQENLSGGNTGTASPGGGGRSEGVCSDELKKTRQQERKERCKSLIDFPYRLNDLPEVSSEVEKGRSESPLPDPLHEQSVCRSPNTSQSSQHLATPQGRDSLYSDEDEAFHKSPDGGKQYGELAKSTSMPQSLSSPSSDVEVLHAGMKERPHSLSGVELSLNMDKMSMLPMDKVSMMPSPTSHVPPGGSESNPFKSFKNVFRRRNSKQRSKKRPASLGQQTTQEYHEALKEHFKKYDLP